MMNKKLQNFIKITLNYKTILGIVMSIAGIYWAFRDFSFDKFISMVKESEYIYIIIAGLAVMFSIWLRAIRWEYFFRQKKRIPVYSLFKAELIGYFGNSVLPLRLGELLRVYIIRKEQNLSGSFVIGTVVLERLLDTVGLLLFSILLIFIIPLPDDIKVSIYWSILVFGIIGLITLLIVLKVKNLKNSHWIVDKIKLFFSAFHVLGGKLSGYTILITVLLWATYWLDVYLVQKSLNMNLGVAGSLVVLIISSLAYAIPSAPGTIGTFHAAVKYSLVTLIGGYSPEIAVTFAIILHAYTYILFTVTGGYYFMKSQFHTDAISKIINKGNK
jgi:glycosyltransferase 2 family protein